MSKFLVLLANGNETIEILTVVDYLRRAGITVDMVSTENSLDLTTSHGVSFKADKLFADIDKSEYNGLYIPGGVKGAESLRDNDKVIEIIKEFNAERKIIAAICAGPIVLNRAGVLENRKATSFPAMEKDLENIGEYIDDEIVVTDENITTGRGAAVTNYLALRLVEILKGEEAKNALKPGIQQNSVEKYFGFEF